MIHTPFYASVTCTEIPARHTHNQEGTEEDDLTTEAQTRAHFIFPNSLPKVAWEQGLGEYFVGNFGGTTDTELSDRTRISNGASLATNNDE